MVSRETKFISEDGSAGEWWGLLDYNQALQRMEQAHAHAVSDRLGGRAPAARLFYLEHHAVITYGRATPPEELELGRTDIPRIAVPRGGLATYHAPGQLVGYIVMDLTQRTGGEADIHAYLRAVEEGLIRFLWGEFALKAVRREGFTGVWTPGDFEGHPGRKLASIGVSARKWVTSHGFALNIHPDLAGFDAIVPCGITDAEMTSVEREMSRHQAPFAVQTMEIWARQAHRYLTVALQEAGWLGAGTAVEDSFSVAGGN